MNGRVQRFTRARLPVSMLISGAVPVHPPPPRRQRRDRRQGQSVGRQLPPIVKAAVNLAGAIAKQRHTGLSWDELAGTVARTDLEMAKAALTRLGAAGPSLVSVVAFTRALVDNNWPAIQLIARELVQRRELDHDEFTAC
jgi:hypothetical protein